MAQSKSTKKLFNMAYGIGQNVARHWKTLCKIKNTRKVVNTFIKTLKQ